MSARNEDQEPVELNVDPDKVGFIIAKARGFDAKVDPVEADLGSNPTDDDDSAVLEDHADDPTLEELRGAIGILDDDEIIGAIALAWVGRGDFDRGGWLNARTLARDRHRGHSAEYLIGMPTLGDLLEEGLAELGYSMTDYDANRP